MVISRDDMIESKRDATIESWAEKRATSELEVLTSDFDVIVRWEQHDDKTMRRRRYIFFIFL